MRKKAGPQKAGVKFHLTQYGEDLKKSKQNITDV